MLNPDLYQAVYHTTINFVPYSGMDLCSCGWIDEGYAMYPIWYSRDGCSNRVCVISCQVKILYQINAYF